MGLVREASPFKSVRPRAERVKSHLGQAKGGARRTSPIELPYGMQYLLCVAFGVVSLITLLLAVLNRGYQARHGHVVPPELQGSIDAETLRKAAAYSRDRSTLGLVRFGVSRLALIWFFFGGGLGLVDRGVAELGLPFVAHGVVFSLSALSLAALMELPFTIYRTFRLEQKHGFNRMTAKLFIGDSLKAVLIGAVLAAGLSAAALALVAALPNMYWLAVWAVLLTFNVGVTMIAPYVIEPLFFKMSELSIPELSGRIQNLADRAGVQVSRVLKVDASRRSSHSNAYFTGLGPVKRVVLFDTLLERMEQREILGVLAHELGHWKKGHIPQRFALGQVATLLGLLVFSWVLPWAGLPHWAFLEQASFPARVTILMFAWSIFSFPLTPLSSAWSRRHEREADQFASDLTQAPESLASALAKLSRDNLAGLAHHPWFEATYASHPNVVERIRRLRSMSQGALIP